jgi:transposase
MTLEQEQEFERLQAENTELRQYLVVSQERVAQLTQQLSVAIERIVELEAQANQAGDPPAFVKPNRQKAEGERQARKKRAAAHNTSRKRSQPTRIERHALEHCPECHYRLRGESLDYRREVVELPPPLRVEVIEHQVVKRWCPHCECWCSPQLDLSGQVFGQGRIGVRVAALVGYLRTTMRLTVRQVQTYLLTLHELYLSVGEIVELAHSVRKQLQGRADRLLEQVRQQPVVHQDETGWRENGQNGYVWATVSEGREPVRYYEYSPSRSHHVAQRLIGEGYRGTLVSDFYAAYNLIPGRHQRCWTHLLRDLHELKEAHAARVDVVQWALAVRHLYDEGKNWLHSHDSPTPEERSQQYASLYQRACGLGQRHARDGQHPCWALAKRLLRHQEELFQFVLVPGVPADNNLAERSIRPLVIMRKISGGTRSDEGSKTRLTLASLLGTWRARGLNPFIECLAGLQRAAQTPQAASP